MAGIAGQIIKSLFILRYLDEVKLRQAIEKQLNKVELADRFTRTVAVGSPREFIQAEKEDQEIAESCNRLIKNAVICWNYLCLTHKLRQILEDGEKEHLRDIISSHSIMTWAHINMLGEYDFSEEKRKDSVGIPPPKKEPYKSNRKTGGKKSPSSDCKRFLRYFTYLYVDGPSIGKIKNNYILNLKLMRML